MYWVQEKEWRAVSNMGEKTEKKSQLTSLNVNEIQSLSQVFNSVEKFAKKKQKPLLRGGKGCFLFP